MSISINNQVTEHEILTSKAAFEEGSAVVPVGSSKTVTPVSPKMKRIVSKLIDSKVTSGARVPGIKVLEDQYWIETLEMRLERAGKVIEGHIYTSILNRTIPGMPDYIERWKNTFQADYSFQDYFNKQMRLCEIPGVKEESEKLKCQAYLDKYFRPVEYYTAEELRHLEVQVAGGKGVLTYATPYFKQWIHSISERQCSEASEEATYREFLAKCPQKEGSSTTTTSFSDVTLCDRSVMFVLTSEGKLYTQFDDKGRAHHTSLAGGAPVLSAGLFDIVDGKIAALNNFSGHYQVGVYEMINFFYFLNDHGALDLLREDATFINAMLDDNGEKSVHPIATWLPAVDAKWVAKEVEHLEALLGIAWHTTQNSHTLSTECISEPLYSKEEAIDQIGKCMEILQVHGFLTKGCKIRESSKAAPGSTRNWEIVVPRWILREIHG